LGRKVVKGERNKFRTRSRRESLRQRNVCGGNGRKQGKREGPCGETWKWGVQLGIRNQGRTKQGK